MKKNLTILIPEHSDDRNGTTGSLLLFAYRS